MSSYFYLQAEENSGNSEFLDKLRDFAKSRRKQVYVLDRPLTDLKYDYNYVKAMIILSPRHRVAVIDYGGGENNFDEYFEDLIEDVSSISDKYQYKGVIGRPRAWKNSLIRKYASISEFEDKGFEDLNLIDEKDRKDADLLISLFIGSINDIERVGADVPETTLDKIKRKIQLFDGEQTEFIYDDRAKKRIKIQGLSGTGKTELLLHKLKDLYISEPNAKIYFTCNNKILADSLRKRIPRFFNFMKVEQQIDWEERLWCTHAWGSSAALNSGAYRYICGFYGLSFYNYSLASFSTACRIAGDELKRKYPNGDQPFALTYMFIDESQDFDENFFLLCEMATEKTIYVAGDIFQSIFDAKISTIIDPDFLLGKCYRTDPKTLMFAHGLGMGLFEEKKIRWLKKKEWEDCGYAVEIRDSKFHLSREPLRRFEDLDDDFESIKIVESSNFVDGIIKIIESIFEENNTATSDDIGIILLDTDKGTYTLADVLEATIQAKLGRAVNKAYESKENTPNSILISNRNNVKGLEFPFVICVTKYIKENLGYRNLLYTMLTRSFIRSYLVIGSASSSGFTNGMRRGLNEIMEEKRMTIVEPTEEEQKEIQTTFETNRKKETAYHSIKALFKEFGIPKEYHSKFTAWVRDAGTNLNDPDLLREFIKDLSKYYK